MLRGCIGMALEDGRVVIFLEPIALYHERDLHADGDGGWLGDYPPPPAALPPGEVGVYGDGTDLAHRQLCERSAPVAQAQATRARARRRRRVMDLRWLNPLPGQGGAVPRRRLRARAGRR